ncbi:MAG TPA: PGPGW domain-containing protein [Syntrophales bacterium]|nr:PGPGW domain-containing protein [Syntrophales bacterium]
MSDGQKQGRNYWRHFVGWPLLLLGVVGLALPFLQGILFIVVALTILAPEVPALRRLVKALRRRYPALFAKAAEIKCALKRRFGQP